VKMAISYKYKSIKRADGVERKLPPVNVIGKGPSWIETMALINSGADVSVIPKDFAELLGLDLGGKREISNGLGGEVSVVNSFMKINIKNPHEDYTFTIPVQVIMEETKVPVILGRDGFFDKFVIEFDHYAKRIKLKNIPVGNRRKFSQ